MSKPAKSKPDENERDAALDDDDPPGSFDDDEPPLWDDVAVPTLDHDDELDEPARWPDGAAPATHPDEPDEPARWHDGAAPPTHPDEPDEPARWPDGAAPPTHPDGPARWPDGAAPATHPDEPDGPPLADPSSEPDAHPLDVRPLAGEVAVPVDASSVEHAAADVRSLDAPSLAPTELFAADAEPEASAPEARPVAPSLELQIAALLADPHKRIVGDIQWSADEDGAQGREFLAPVRCAGAELRVRGQTCAAAGSLRFSLLLRGVGRIAALDIGHAHQAADGQRRGETHFHRRDRREHLTDDLEPLAADDLAGAWRRFCALTNITHEGALDRPQPAQETLL